MLASGLAAPTNSLAGIAAATASPAVSYQIGQYFKGLAQNNSDGQLTAKQETAHIVAHSIWGAAVSAAGGNNALAGALSAGGAEAAAPIISHYLYGEADGSKLTAEQKETVVAITGMLGTTVGVVAGNTAADAVQGSLNANSAVENNDSSDYDGNFAGDRVDNNHAKSIYPNSPKNQELFLKGKNEGKLLGAQQGIKDIWDGITSLPQSTLEEAKLFIDSYGLVPVYTYNKGQQLNATIKAVKVEWKAWQAAYENAKIHDPYLAGQMYGMMNGWTGVNVATVIIPSGAIIQSGKFTKLGALLSKQKLNVANASKKIEEVLNGLNQPALVTPDGQRIRMPSKSDIPSNATAATSHNNSVNNTSSGVKLSTPNLIHNKSLRNAYEDIISGKGTPNIDSKTGKQKIYRGDENSAWAGATEWLVPNSEGRHDRILRLPNGRMGYVINHDYNNIRPFPSPWYPDGGNLKKPVR